MPADDSFFDPEEKTLVQPGTPTPPRGLPLPDFEQGYNLGYTRGVADFAHKLRLALAWAKVPPDEIEPIVVRVRLWKI